VGQCLIILRFPQPLESTVNTTPLDHSVLVTSLAADMVLGFTIKDVRTAEKMRNCVRKIVAEVLEVERAGMKLREQLAASEAEEARASQELAKRLAPANERARQLTLVRAIPTR
jgi:hypothetical protein